MSKKIVVLVISAAILTSVQLAEARRHRPFEDRLSRRDRRSRQCSRCLRRSLAELGYVEGQNIAIEFRGAESGPKLSELANELVREKVEVIVAGGGPAARSAQGATTTIPIVFATSGDPVESGFVDSLARPGGRMTGMSWLSFELVGKRLELLKEAVPQSLPCGHSVQSSASG